MRILFICHRFPYPPTRGGKIRPFNIIKHLNERHEVVVASIARSSEEAEAGKQLASYCESYHQVTVNEWAQFGRMIGRIPSPAPSSFGYFYSRPLARAIRRILSEKRFDLIFAHCSSVAPYVADVRGPAKILDFGDMDSCKWLDYSRHRSFPLNLGYRLEGEKVARWEHRLTRKFDLCTTTTRAELDTLLSYCPPGPTDWFPNGVDYEYFTPAPSYDPNTICFVGRMDYYPNQECMFTFCRTVFPSLSARFPQLRLLIVGAEPSRAIRALGRITGVTVTGSVRDVRPYLGRSALMVAPMSIARGTQNKVLEAMAMGVPVVASPLAARGVDAIPGEHFVAASSPEEYIEAISGFIECPERRAAFAAAGRARVLSHHSWAQSMSKVDSLVQNTVEMSRNTASHLGSIYELGPGVLK